MGNEPCTTRSNYICDLRYHFSRLYRARVFKADARRTRTNYRLPTVDFIPPNTQKHLGERKFGVLSPTIIPLLARSVRLGLGAEVEFNHISWPHFRALLIMPRVTGSPKQIIALELPASTAEAISLVQSFTNSATETEAIRLMIRSFRGFVDRADQPEFKALIESAAAATLDTRADIRLNLGLTEPQRASLGVIQRVLQRESAKQTIVALADFFCREIKAATTPGPILQKRLSSGELLLMLWS